MANPVTKNNLESAHFLSFDGAVQARLLACLRNDGSNIRPFSPPSEAIQAIKEGLNRVQPKNPGMKRITDSIPNTFDQQTIDAVLSYKSINGIIRAGQKLDNIVGRGTLARLDTELKNFGPAPVPTPVIPEFGSTQWTFRFFCDKGIFGKGEFSLLINRSEVQDSADFAIREIFAGSGLASGFKGVSRGAFTTSKKILVDRFASAVVDFSITRGTTPTLRGNMRLQLRGDDALTASFLLPDFQDETLGLTQGITTIRGLMGTGT